MNNLVNETNGRLTDIINNLTTIKKEYEGKLKSNNKEIDSQLEKVKKYKTEFFESKAKIEKMNADIEGFETDYQKLVERFKDDELANILIAANKEISLKIDERKRKIIKDKNAMNELVDKAENVKSKLVKLTAEKKALELCLSRIVDAYNYYSKVLGDIIDYSSAHKDNLTGSMPSISQDEDIISNLDTNIESSFGKDEDSIIENANDILKDEKQEEQDDDNQETLDDEHNEVLENDDVLEDVLSKDDDENQDEDDNEALDDDNNKDEDDNEVMDKEDDFLKDDNQEILEDEDDDIDIDEDIVSTNRERSIEIVQESDINFMDDVEDEDTGILAPIDISDMVKDEEVNDYDNEETVESDEHKIVSEEKDINNKKGTTDKIKKEKEKKEDKEEDISIDVDFDDSLEDDDSLYE